MLDAEADEIAAMHKYERKSYDRSLTAGRRQDFVIVKGMRRFHRRLDTGE